ncbi:hypothetical protein Tco_0259845, partial [Tanacetum coccineum]
RLEPPDIRARQSHSGTDYHRPMSQPSDISDKLSHPSVDSLEGHWCNLIGSLSRVNPSISDPIADCLGSLSSGFGIESADVGAGLRRARKVDQVATACEEPSGHVYDVRGTLVGLRRA